MLGRKGFKRESGQVLPVALVGIVAILFAAMLLFDIQNVIRGKIKIQNAVDAAALTGAEWQRKGLNLIGELNLARAANLLVSDPFYGIGADEEEFTQMPGPDAFFVETPSGPVFQMEAFLEELRRVDEELKQLQTANALVSQLQTRLAFVCPLIGFGAAQQAAKNNGLNYNEEAGDFFFEFLGLLNDQEFYGNPAIANPVVNGYEWRTPYINMVMQMMDIAANEAGSGNTAYGIAAGTRFMFLGAPSLAADSPSILTSYLGRRSFYEAIYARHWCYLKDVLLDGNFNGNWWGDFKCDYNSSFMQQAEILPLHISYWGGEDAYLKVEDMGAFADFLDDDELLTERFDVEDPYPFHLDDEGNFTFPHLESDGFYYLNGRRVGDSETARILFQFPDYDNDGVAQTIIYNGDDEDLRSNLLPYLSWAVFDNSWSSYGDDYINAWRGYLRSPFREGFDYFSGARAYFEAKQDTRTVTGYLGRNQGGGTVGSALFGEGKDKLSAAELNLRATSVPELESDALAKPFGSIRLESGEVLRPFEAGRMVLPVFTHAALIPISLEPVYGISTLDVGWYYFLTEFVPILGHSASLQAAWSEASGRYPDHANYFSYYYNALLMLDDPEYRNQGIEWLNDPAPGGGRNKDHCDDWGSGGGDGTRYGPGSLH